MAALLDAAMGMPNPLSYLDGAASLFRMFERRKDAAASAWIGCL